MASKDNGEREPIGDGPKSPTTRSAEELNAENVYLKILVSLRDREIESLKDTIKLKNVELEKFADKVFFFLTGEFKPYVYGDIAKAIREKLVSGTPTGATAPKK